MPDFLRDLAEGAPKAVYKNETFPDLKKTPLPRWELLNISHYATLMLQGSRGCPFNCDFCDITNMFGRKPRVKPAESMLAELQSIYDLGWRGTIFFVDDNFIGNKAKIKQILPQIIEWQKERDYPYEFLTEASINLAEDDELIELMVDAGFDTVFIGLETPNEASLKECEKNQNLKSDLITSISHLQSKGLQVLGGYIVGFDNDDESIFSRQIKFIQESGVVTAMVGLLNALPNTKLWQRMNAERRLLDSGSTGDNCDGTINFIPKMDKDKLLEGYRQVVKTIYSPRAYYQRVSRFLEKYQPRRKKQMTWRDARAFLRSVWVLGLLGNGRSQFYYWKMLVKSFFFYRNKFAEAVTLMIYGHHFRKVVRQMERRGKAKRISSGEPEKLTVLM